MTRARMLIAGLAVVLAWAVIRTLALPDGASDSRLTTERADRAVSGKRGKGQLNADDIPVVVAGLARSGAAEAFERERSLFDFAKSPEEVHAEEEARRQAEADAKRRAEEAARAAAAAAEAAALRAKQEAEARAAQAQRDAEHLKANPPKPVPPSFSYQYVGTIGPVDDPYAILTSTDRQFRYVKVGELIDDKFKLEYIGEKRLDLSYVDSRFADQFAQVQRAYDAATKPR